jgi:hypothetical protein
LRVENCGSNILQPKIDKTEKVLFAGFYFREFLSFRGFYFSSFAAFAKDNFLQKKVAAVRT